MDGQDRRDFLILILGNRGEWLFAPAFEGDDDGILE